MNWKQAFALGLIAPGAWDGKGEPVAYLYNGVRLPKLPELVYPYAIIHRGGAEQYFLVVTDIPLSIDWYTESTGWVDFDNDLRNVVRYELAGDGSGWAEEGRYTNVSYGPGLQTLVWCNYDVKTTEDGNVYLPASNPVPVYE